MVFHTLTFTRSRRRCSKPRPVFNISRGTWQTLMYWKIMFDSCYCINSICLFVKIWETIWHFILLPFGRQRASAHFLNIRLPGPSASRSSRWLPSFDSTWTFRSDSTRWLLYNCSSANKIQIHQQKRRKAYLYMQ